MRYLVPCVEQLDRAAKELHEDSVVSARLALILTDNVVELMIHRRCETIFSRKAPAWMSDPPEVRYNRAAQHRVLGRHFDQKLKFLKSEGDISQAEYSFIIQCHDVRGEAYHTGLAYDEILRPLAWHYHELACALFARLQSSTRSYNPRTLISERYAAHLPAQIRDDGFSAYAMGVESQISESLHAARPSLPLTLSEFLAKHLSDSVERIEMLLGIIKRTRPDAYSIDREIAEAQWFIDLYADVPDNIDFHSNSYREHISRKVIAMRSQWSPKHSVLSIVPWKKRIRNLKQANTYSALQRYFSIMCEIRILLAPIENIVGGIEARAEVKIERNRTNR
jgi:hypothetical protein